MMTPCWLESDNKSKTAAVAVSDTEVEDSAVAVRCDSGHNYSNYCCCCSTSSCCMLDMVVVVVVVDLATE